jgi:hypothetical protein
VADPGSVLHDLRVPHPRLPKLLLHLGPIDVGDRGGQPAEVVRIHVEHPAHGGFRRSGLQEDPGELDQRGIVVADPSVGFGPGEPHDLVQSQDQL